MWWEMPLSGQRLVQWGEGTKQQVGAVPTPWSGAVAPGLSSLPDFFVLYCVCRNNRLNTENSGAREILLI